MGILRHRHQIAAVDDHLCSLFVDNAQPSLMISDNAIFCETGDGVHGAAISPSFIRLKKLTLPGMKSMARQINKLHGVENVSCL